MRGLQISPLCLVNQCAACEDNKGLVNMRPVRTHHKERVICVAVTLKVDLLYVFCAQLHYHDIIRPAYISMSICLGPGMLQG